MRLKNFAAAAAVVTATGCSFTVTMPHHIDLGETGAGSPDVVAQASCTRGAYFVTGEEAKPFDQFLGVASNGNNRVFLDVRHDAFAISDQDSSKAVTFSAEKNRIMMAVRTYDYSSPTWKKDITTIDMLQNGKVSVTVRDNLSPGRKPQLPDPMAAYELQDMKDRANRLMGCTPG